jgi:ABC-type multidrug transport system ATPase subunit
MSATANAHSRATRDHDAAVLEVSGLTRRFGEVVGLPSIDLTVARGERVALVGPNGSGKTTLMRCVTGTMTPTTGEARVCGHPAGTLAARRSLGASLSQERSFYLRLTGRENLRFFARLRATRRGPEADRAVTAVIDELELADIAARRMDRCSSGMIQQLSFARALLGDPPLLLLDEPTRSLDEAAIERLWAALERRDQAAIVIATHRREDIERCERRLDLAR